MPHQKQLSPGPDADSARRDTARWTHAWMSAATLTLGHLEDAWDDQRPAMSVGARDALTLVLVDAVRNTYRGAIAVLGPEHTSVHAFEQAVPGLKDLRDRLEHFDDYLRGTGRHQPKDPRTAPNPAAPLRIVGSAGGGPEGHTISVAVSETTGTRTYDFATTTAVDAARSLAKVAITDTGLDDSGHAACPHCPA